MADKTYQLEIVTPEKKVYSEQVEFAVFPGTDGELGVLVNHAPLLSSLNAGEIRITRDKTVQCLAISGGFLEVMHNDVSVIAETAEFANEIDKSRAQKAKESAEAALAAAQSEEEKTAAKVKLAKAVARLTVAEKAKA